MSRLTKVRKVVDGLLAQIDDYGVGHTIRQNYLLRVSPAYRSLVQTEAPRWLGTGRLRTTGGLSVHMLLCARDLTMGLCAAASFVRAYGEDLTLHFHDDGSLRSGHVDRIGQVFPDAQVILRAVADRQVDDWLRDCPLSRSLRRQCFMLVKFFDPLVFGGGDWRLLLDSDVMFFRRPDRLREIVARGEPRNWFNQDIASSYCIAESAAQALLGTPLAPRLNAGLALIHRQSIDPAKCDPYLAACDFVKRPWVIEQTLHAMFSSVFGVSHLPSEYELNPSRCAAPGAVSKHYVGRMTEMFFVDGLARLLAAKEGGGPVDDACA